MERRIASLLLVAGSSLAQAPGDLQFEVASVRALPPVTKGPNGPFMRITGGPGTSDPERLQYTTAPMLEILARAFQAQADQFVAPDWVTNVDGPDRFEITARVPPGSTQEQANLMMQNLLKQRFHLAFHREKRELEVYELTIAKGGSKLQPAEIPDKTPALPTGPLRADKGDDGYPRVPAGSIEAIGLSVSYGVQVRMLTAPLGEFMLVNPRGAAPGAGFGLMRYTFRMLSMPQLAGALKLITGWAHIVDHTGLAGKYDFTLGFAMGGGGRANEASEPAPDIFAALEKQLGLKLVKTRQPLDVIVIDRIDRTPVEN